MESLSGGGGGGEGGVEHTSAVNMLKFLLFIDLRYTSCCCMLSSESSESRGLK